MTHLTFGCRSTDIQGSASGPVRSVKAEPSFFFAVPGLAFFILFAMIPLIGVCLLSFVRWDGIGNMSFAGFANWKTVLTSPTLLKSFKLTLLLMVASWLIQTPISILLGVYMAKKNVHREVLSFLYFLPLLFSAAALGIAFKALLDPNFGISKAFNIPLIGQDWLGNSHLALPMVVLVIAWMFIPFHSLIYQGGVRQIPKSLYEAATIDGANSWQCFWKITIPQLRYTIVTDSTLQLVGALTYFDLIYVLTGGGPGNATQILPLYMYEQGFRSFQMGTAATVGVALLFFGLCLSLGLNSLSGASKMESEASGA